MRHVVVAVAARTERVGTAAEGVAVADHSETADVALVAAVAVGEPVPGGAVGVELGVVAGGSGVVVVAAVVVVVA